MRQIRYWHYLPRPNPGSPESTAGAEFYLKLASLTFQRDAGRANHLSTARAVTRCNYKCGKKVLRQLGVTKNSTTDPRNFFPGSFDGLAIRFSCSRATTPWIVPMLQY